MPKFWRQMAMEWQTLMQYRLDMSIWTLTGLITPLLAMVVWLAVARDGQGPFTAREAITYYILIVFVGLVTDVWNGYFLINDIRRGDLVKYLVKPYPALSWYISENAAEKVWKLAVPLPLLLLALAIWPGIFSPEIFVPARAAWFFLSLCLAAVISFLFDMSLGMVAFWTAEANELRGFKGLVQEFASGMIIPFAALPSVVAAAFSFLPYRFILSVPVEILMGKIAGADVTRYLGWQLLWVLVLSAVMRLAWTQGLKRYAIPGQ